VSKRRGANFDYDPLISACAARVEPSELIVDPDPEVRRMLAEGPAAHRLSPGAKAGEGTNRTRTGRATRARD
jgi:hypothetical protein